MLPSGALVGSVEELTCKVNRCLSDGVSGWLIKLEDWGKADSIERQSVWI